MPQNLLILEDNEDLIQTLNETLLFAGFNPLLAMSVRQAKNIATSEKIDLAIIDMLLPDGKGTDFLSFLKNSKLNKNTLAIFLTAVNDEKNKIDAFLTGADDYLAKPFSINELLLRIKALLRRYGKKEANNLFKGKNYYFDFESHHIEVEDKQITLTALEMNLLRELVINEGKVLSRSKLLSSVWNIDAFITTRTVDIHIKRLRDKLLGAKNNIETLRGFGYRFVA